MRVAAPRTQPGGWPGGAELDDLNAQSATRARRSARPVPTTRSTETRAHRGPGPRRALRALYRPPVPDAPIAELPDYITLTRDEAATVLSGLDVVVEATDIDTEEAAKVRRAVRLVTTKLWPELGDLLDEDDGE